MVIVLISPFLKFATKWTRSSFVIRVHFFHVVLKCELPCVLLSTNCASELLKMFRFVPVFVPNRFESSVTVLALEPLGNQKFRIELQNCIAETTLSIVLFDYVIFVCYARTLHRLLSEAPGLLCMLLHIFDPLTFVIVGLLCNLLSIISFLFRHPLTLFV
jgi:hypothetical protein